MKKLLSLLAAASLAFSFATAHAADGDAPKKAPTAQQTKMKTCNAEASGKKGDERKAFMKECLSTKKATQQDKMKSCNAEAKTKDLKGDARKGFMKECLAGAHAA
ncbi:MAG: PsiF family protein [Acidovorax sp.]|uniref:PsiF family protein n=1 Tax=Acidovorax sp. TaxID=1872122 RepID=UPI0039E3380D